MIRIAAINQIDRSAYTEPVVVKTQEEGKTNLNKQVALTTTIQGQIKYLAEFHIRDGVDILRC